MRGFITSVCLTLFISSTLANTLKTRPVAFHTLPGWRTASQQKALSAFKRSCSKMQKSSRWRRVCQAVKALPRRASSAQARHFFEQYFRAYQVSNGHGATEGLFTGYYLPTIPGSLHRTGYFSVPLYAKPRNLVRVRINGINVTRLKVNGKLIKLPTRDQIVQQGLDDTPILAWIHSRIDRLFMQIQGSGAIQLSKHKLLLLGYAGQNGHPYYPVGKYLLQIGALNKNNVSMQSIRAWLEKHPTEQAEVLEKNQAFTFFRVLAGEDPLGAQRVPLTAGRSLAIDYRLIAYGTPIWLTTFYPKKTKQGIIHGAPLRRLMIAQDTGGAIRGAVRGDVYWGSSERAKWLAGHMQSKGKLWILRPKA